MHCERNDLDRRIWTDELDAFVPARVFDVHSHIYRWADNVDPDKETGPYGFVGQRYPMADAKTLDACDQVLMPGREVHRLAFPFPFSPACDFSAANQFVAQQTKSDPLSASLMLVHPSMTAEDLDAQIEDRGFIGLKPYRTYSVTGDPDECRITDFLPEPQLAVADRRELIVMLHISKRLGIADRQNTDDLMRLTDTFPRVKWILAHCARSYSSWGIERAAKHLRGLSSVWYDTSSVCESDAIEALCTAVGSDRVMYGSDDVPVGIMRGKYVAFGFAWSFLSEDNHSFNLSHCDGRMTFTRYEQLRAMRRAAIRLGLTRDDIEDLFCHTATRLVQSVRGEVCI